MIYLAAPYTHHDDVVCDIRARMVTYAAAVLTECGLHVYSPLTHGHQLAANAELPTEYWYWQSQCEYHVNACERVAVLMLDGWDESIGVQAEVDIAQRMGKPVSFLHFWDVL